MAYRHPKLEYLRHWPIGVPSGRLIYNEGEAPEAFYRVDLGCVRLQTYREDGRRQVLAFCLPGDLFGLDFSGARSTAAEATTMSKLTRFPLHQDLKGGVGHDCSALLAASSKISENLSAAIIGFGLSSAAERVMWFLNWLAERQGARARHACIVHLPMSRRDIADYLGLAPETLSRTLTHLAESGRIEKFGRKVLLAPAHGPLRASTNYLEEPRLCSM
jgi:CRP-like cAMP-binding protein